ncbi:MAG TPA: ATP-binding protein [Flavisolibacter sp.]|jgi:signal transduction histidine kinase|nr:ATP-binding protein [Flavisolibacter sp.]
MQFSTKAAKLVFLLTTIVLLGLSALLYKQITSLLDSQRQVNSTNVLKLKLERLLTALVDTETAQRGFLLTQDSLFLEPYQGAYQRAKGLLVEIDNLTPSSEYDQAKFNALQTFVEVRFGSFHHPLGTYKDSAITVLNRDSYLRQAKANMDSIRYYVKEIETRANQMLHVREEENRKYTFLTPLFAILLMVFSILILGFSYERILKQLKRTKKLLFRLKKLNNKLKQNNYQLELSNRELEQFTYIASHDLKEPLRKIMTYTSLVMQQGHSLSQEEIQLHLQKISSFAERMQNLLDDLLLYSHTSQGDSKVEDVDLNNVVAEVIQNLDEEIAETGAEIKYDHLPVIKGIPYQLRQLFQNLVSNSLKYRQQKRRPVITIESDVVTGKELGTRPHKVSGQYVRLLFRDNGIGFNQAYADRVFRLFQRLHTTEGYKGTGIGLTICKKVVDNHQGFIQARSAVNEGAIFEIYFPL